MGMFRFGTVMVVAMLLAAPAYAHEAAPPPPPKKEAPKVPIKFAETKRGTVLANSDGMTLYYFDRDDSGTTSTCDGKCTEKWIPLKAVDDSKPQGDFTVMVRNDKSKMWAYRNRPLYTSRDDKAAGDVNGFDPANLWHVARPAN
jgi:predicted lipoprotein with Yx(FWY)xxD motif